VAWDRATGKPIEHALPVSIGSSRIRHKASAVRLVAGGIALLAADGFAYEIRNRMTCAAADIEQQKPFCDASMSRADSVTGLNPVGPGPRFQ